MSLMELKGSQRSLALPPPPILPSHTQPKPPFYDSNSLPPPTQQISPRSLSHPCRRGEIDCNLIPNEVDEFIILFDP